MRSSSYLRFSTLALSTVMLNSLGCDGFWEQSFMRGQVTSMRTFQPKPALNIISTSEMDNMFEEEMVVSHVPKKSVQFDPYVTIYSISNMTEDDKMNAFYTKDEYRRFKYLNGEGGIYSSLKIMYYYLLMMVCLISEASIRKFDSLYEANLTQGNRDENKRKKRKSRSQRKSIKKVEMKTVEPILKYSQVGINNRFYAFHEENMEIKKVCFANDVKTHCSGRRMKSFRLSTKEKLSLYEKRPDLDRSELRKPKND